ncbi:hypothetical protein A3G67_04510 [Candidatus Roizmanbacteria bacterium RIFCSPLOWO2_12_FULL_40_12]|uniref:Glycosyltransferase RgtA/B/C/D-like domain-containing protein n=1 Tax=Candidatus Roizmanbacteria bacterium RIFCSPLOWO2_01_FULL_40_42 TaxID=1802066 RepID=A0A1F7J4R7_9BACT|nr:MAG: hypothetical protein A2779_04640 [Candidatus Roizmanbacteria bacterium RIFCSPHIGHO2_01_FULL_40_98]OGK27362.1 MAG: hypothetical protein A3C31_04965 [Candidatus Roizmanbacteria bacterium RIFCSPHIGHO2_02_FULL_40_53]OGK30766.1 MAG: hypothetical protein A2W49_02075 [Candidatus Roizmanbacteria bacterium RIFCSPHIGHO2_12_41_18]OGK36467.1 MAG: hypothetical protein A3E69_02590 [Candidatus Roizmanbacteria bacterium RIFCSPHIGHO2_12_FULL_40_130]OGK50595.1 MAG: hypothetical protein A3B50_02320 [Candi
MKKEKPSKLFKRIDFILLGVILLLALVFRLYKISAPLGDFHSWRQADTASVARNFATKDFNLLKPRYHDFSNIQSGLENPQGYRFVEFPVYNAIIAALWKYIPLTSLEIYGRLVTIFFSLSIIGILYYFLLKETGRIAAVAATFTYAVFPFFVFFSRVILPETTALAFTFLALLFLYFFTFGKNKVRNTISYSLALLFFIIGVLAKPTVIFYSFSFLTLFIIKYRWNIHKKILPYLFFIATAIPYGLWTLYISQYPAGIPSCPTCPEGTITWLMKYVNTTGGLQDIFFKPSFFRWIFFERINNIILGGYLTVFFVLGFFIKPKRYFIHSLWFSSLVYILVFQGGNVQHEYYQTLILPALAALIGIGVNLFAAHNKIFISQMVTFLLIIGLFGFSFFISFYHVRGYFNYSQDQVNMARVVRDLTKSNSKIVTDTLGDTTLLYLSEREGSPSVFKSLPDLKNDGYEYFVTSKQDVISQIKKEKVYAVLFENNQFAIFAL